MGWYSDVAVQESANGKGRSSNRSAKPAPRGFRPAPLAHAARVWAAEYTTTPFHRAANTEEIAEVVGFLASPRASYVTGAVVAADGGRTAI